MMNHLYVLQGKTPVLEPDITKWLVWWRSADNLVMKTRIDTDETVVTFFMAFDGGMEEGCPLLFETRVMGGHLDGMRGWYATWAEAEANHEWIVQLVMGEPA